MLSYRHAYHAGNHADVLKHLTLMLVLKKLLQKDKPLTYFDTHAAAGLYDLSDTMAQATLEFAQGIDALRQLTTPSKDLGDFLSLVDRYRQQGLYPGSPMVAAELLRPDDRLVLMELHNTEIDNLRRNVGRDTRVSCHHRNGFEGVLAVAPPTPKRGLVLIDPSYERAEEYREVVDFVQNLQKKWPVGVIAIWYPLLAKARNRAPAMLQQLARQTSTSLFVAELWTQPQADEFGMYGSGMALLNLPWQVDGQLCSLLPELQQALAQTEGGCRAEWLVSPR